MIRIVPILFLAFNIWMLVDVFRRRAPIYWVFIILFLPFGGVIYFFVIKLQDFRSGNAIGGGGGLGRSSIRGLRNRYAETPSLENQLILAQALCDSGKHDEAADLFEQVLERYPENKEALLGLGSSKIAQKRFAAAVEPLKKLIELHQGYHDYKGWTLLAQALWEDDLKEDSLEVLQKLNRFNPRIDHELMLVRCLVLMDKHEEAKKIIHTAIAEFEQAPPHLQRKQRADADEMKKLRRQLG